ncbi:DUF559 domain-containing protein [Natronosporangium hydrolyticum]|uniref:DUF559 domain-containing protein n=2 Tax=Natronosporangium hydrolyticum TaxID=2811111 RepID=A0A895YN15_9ACTN|nr:DUF559 domain-containing protein [Natronosporangium hydrolyticum]
MLLARSGGVLTRAQASEVVPGWVLDHANRLGELRRVLPGVYLDGRGPDGRAQSRRAGEGRARDGRAPAEPRLNLRAALAWLDQRGALSHTSALAVWGLHEPVSTEPVHVTVPPSVRLRSQPAIVGFPGVEVHRRGDFRAQPPHVLERDQHLVTPLDRSLVDAWAVLPVGERRGPLINAVADRLTTPDRLQAGLASRVRLPGRTEYAELVSLLAAGCLSPLEIWGHQHVFTGPGMPRFRRQVRLPVGRRSIYLDVFAEAEQVDFELDGAAHHGDRRARERDLRRDALLATLGILVVRFSHRRLVTETESVRQEIRAVLASRRNVGRS